MPASPVSLAARWGRSATRLERLASEVDETYRATFDDGTVGILKIAVADTSPESLDFECALVAAALAVDPTLPLARVIPTPQGETLIDTDGRWARLVECLPGRDASAEPLDLPLVREIGRLAGRMTHALEGFRHPSDRRAIAWDVRRAPALRGRLGFIDDGDLRIDLARALGDLDATLPLVEQLPAQVVHNDLNGGNVLVDHGRVTGIVDFGDAGFLPRACDVGIAMSYTLGYTAEAEVDAAPAAFLAGYREHVVLTRDELAVLPVIVRARAAQRVLMSVAVEASIGDEGRRDEAARIARASTDLRRLIAAGDQGSTA